jgi:hypothetical protein
MADPNADIIQSEGVEKAVNPQAVNFEDGLDAVESNGVVSVGLKAGGIATAKLANASVTGAKLADGKIRHVAVADTNGTTAVSVFGASGLGVAITIKSVYVIALDTTAGNITVENPAATVVCTVAKGTSAGVVVGATTLENTTVDAGTDLVVDSSSEGNARVHIVYEVA